MRRPLPPCIDGVRDLKEIDATHFDAVLETRVAYMRFNFKVAVEMTKISPSDAIYAKVEGTRMGMVRRLTAAATTQLSEADGRTLIRYSIDATLTGKIGSRRQPVLNSKAKEMEKQFAARIAAEFAPGGAKAVSWFHLNS
jgi:carbon monoxide dehydrogenase subunit G